MSAVPGGFAGTRAAGKRLAPEVNRILSVRNLPFKVTAEQIYEIFGKVRERVCARFREKGWVGGWVGRGWGGDERASERASGRSRPAGAASAAARR